MAGPTWLFDSLAVLMVVTSLYCAGRLVASRRRDRATQRDVDAVHVVMGIVMAGMLAGALAFGWNGLWKSLFGVSAAWFAWRSISALIRSRARSGAVSHHVGHLVTSGAMCAMFVAVPAANAGASTTMSASAGMGGMGDMAGMGAGSGAAGWWPAVAVLLAVVLFGYANWYVRALILVGTRSTGPGGVSTAPLPPTTLSPRLALCCEIVMSLTMGYMLIVVR
jgi:hypothetical protein